MMFFHFAIALSLSFLSISAGMHMLHCCHKCKDGMGMNSATCTGDKNCPCPSCRKGCCHRYGIFMGNAITILSSILAIILLCVGISTTVHWYKNGGYWGMTRMPNMPMPMPVPR